MPSSMLIILNKGRAMLSSNSLDSSSSTLESKQKLVASNIRDTWPFSPAGRCTPRCRRSWSWSSVPPLDSLPGSQKLCQEWSASAQKQRLSAPLPSAAALHSEVKPARNYWTVQGNPRPSWICQMSLALSLTMTRRGLTGFSNEALRQLIPVVCSSRPDG